MKNILGAIATTLSDPVCIVTSGSTISPTIIIGGRTKISFYGWTYGQVSWTVINLGIVPKRLGN